MIRFWFHIDNLATLTIQLTPIMLKHLLNTVVEFNRQPYYRTDTLQPYNTVSMNAISGMSDSLKRTFLHNLVEQEFTTILKHIQNIKTSDTTNACTARLFLFWCITDSGITEVLNQLSVGQILQILHRQWHASPTIVALAHCFRLKSVM